MTYARTFTILTLLLLVLPLSARSIFDLVYTGNDEPVAIRLEVPVDSVLAKVNTKQDAYLKFTDVNGRVQNWDLNVSIRGKFRRQRCEFAPLKLDFGKKDLRKVGLEDWDKYKLVSTCSSDPLAKNLVLKEYLAYRAYNILTPQSYRTLTGSRRASLSKILMRWPPVSAAKKLKTHSASPLNRSTQKPK